MNFDLNTYIPIIKKQSDIFHESIISDMKEYMELSNHFILVKTSLIPKDGKLYFLEIDTAATVTSKTQLDLSILQDFLVNNNYSKLVFWNVGCDRSLYNLMEKEIKIETVNEDVGDFVYMDFSDDPSIFNFQQTFNREFAFIEHLSTNKRWVRQYLGDKLNFPKQILRLEDVTEKGNGVPDFVMKDTELDSGKGIYLFDKEDYQDAFVDEYCEDYIVSDYYLNTYHLCGKNISIDITDYENLQPTITPEYKYLSTKTEIENRLDLSLQSRYKSYFEDSKEYEYIS